MNDLISRQDAVECVYKALKTPPLKGVFTDTMSLAIGMVNELPSAQPERPKGEWKTEWHYFFHVDLPICSYCLQFSPFKYDFCPRCGADMREVRKTNDRP